MTADTFAVSRPRAGRRDVRAAAASRPSSSAGDQRAGRRRPGHQSPTTSTWWRAPSSGRRARATSAATGRSGPAISDQVVWSALLRHRLGLRSTSTSAMGSSPGSLDGRHELNPNSDYRLRVRFLGDAAPAGTDWSEWAVREFETTAATAVQPLVLSTSRSFRRRAGATSGQAGHPAGPGSGAARLRLEVSGGGAGARSRRLDGSSNQVSTRRPLAAHGALRADLRRGKRRAGAARVDARLHRRQAAQDREIALPAVALAPGETAAFWIAEAGGAFRRRLRRASAGRLRTSRPVDRAVGALGGAPAGIPRRALRDGASASRSTSRSCPGSRERRGRPFLYVAELYGSIKVVSRGGAVSAYASNLLNFDPTGAFPGLGREGPDRHRGRSGDRRRVRQLGLRGARARPTSTSPR